MTYLKQTNNHWFVLACIRLKEKRASFLDNAVKNLFVADKFGLDLQPPSLLRGDSSWVKSKEHYIDFLLFYQTLHQCHSFAKKYWQHLDIILNNDFMGAVPSPLTQYCEQLDKTFYQRYTKDIVSILNGKTLDQLCQLTTDVDCLLSSDSSFDLDFWGKVRKILQAQEGRIWLIFMHRDLLRRYLEKQQIDRLYQKKFNGNNNRLEYIDNVINDYSQPIDTSSKKLFNIPKIRLLRLQVAYKTAKWLYTAKSNLSPHFLKLGNNVTIYTHPTFQLINRNNVGGYDGYMHKNQSENFFNNKENLQLKKTLNNLQSQILWLHRQVYLRRPKFFNRVHTGYEWNKFNQTHYDSDNTPPKVVFGYKFNIFYPDIICDSKTPSYSVERDNESRDSSTCIIRFSAILPYKDIAFRIVNKQWEMSRKKGFACIYENRVLHLHFNFLRLRYRR